MRSAEAVTCEPLPEPEAKANAHTVQPFPVRRAVGDGRRGADATRQTADPDAQSEMMEYALQYASSYSSSCEVPIHRL